MKDHLFTFIVKNVFMNTITCCQNSYLPVESNEFLRVESGVVAYTRHGAQILEDRA